MLVIYLVTEKTLVILVIGGKSLWCIHLYCQCLVVVTGNGGNSEMILFFYFFYKGTICTSTNFK